MNGTRRWLAAAAVMAVCAEWSVAEEGFESLVKRAAAAHQQGKAAEAVQLLTQAIALAPNEPRGYFLRGLVHESQRRHPEAIADLTHALKLDAELAEAYDHRGSQRLAAGQVDEALADFDRYLALRPAAARSHWKRGIACYYAGQYAEGRKQFEAYQTFDDADVENAVWRFLCMARSEGFDAARRGLLKIGDDRRVPMRQIYELFAGRAKPEDVLAAAEAGQPAAEVLNHRLFYAHQYLGLYYEALGDEARARHHTQIAAARHKIGHYMWDIAHMHAQRLNQPQKPAPPKR